MNNELKKSMIAYLRLKYKFESYGSMIHELVEVFESTDINIITVAIRECIDNHWVIYIDTKNVSTAWVKDPTRLLKLVQKNPCK